MDDLFHVEKPVRDLRGHLPLKQQTRTLRDMKVPGGIRGDRMPPGDAGVGLRRQGRQGDHAQQTQPALVGRLGVTCPAIRSSIDSSSRRSTRSAAIKVRMSGSDNALRSVNS